MSKYDKVIDLALRRSIFFPTAEIYNGPAGFYDYGPIGVVLKRNFIELWREYLVKRDGMAELDGAVTLPEKVYAASGHLAHFVDPMTECRRCKAFHRIDKLLETKLKKTIPENLSEKEFDKLAEDAKLKCPNCGGELLPTKKFNMLYTFATGPRGEEKLGLRPETCQNIFIDFPRLYKTNRFKLPIGIAQVGKSFRNEISPRQSLLRQREFTQAEIEVFFNPTREFEKFDEIKKFKLKLQPLNSKNVIELSAEDAVRKKIISHKLIAYYLVLLQQFYDACGLSTYRFRQLSSTEKAFYAKEAWDFEVYSPDVGWLELVACNYRGEHDLSAHQNGSKQDFLVPDNNEKVLPHVFELSMGVDRSLYAILEQAYYEEKVKGETRIVLKLKPKLAPFSAAVFPLVNKDNLPKLAQKVYNE
ncbi:MAG: glycine--tRNA ligase, partial [Candidatus Nanoarchaeia archaeon]